MNRGQKAVLILGLMIILVMIVHPPWYCSTWRMRGASPAPPPGMIPHPWARVRATEYAPLLPYPPPRLREPALNFRRLAIQCIAAAGLKPALNFRRLAIQCIAAAGLTLWFTYKVRT